MKRPMLSRKRPLYKGYNTEPLYSKKCLSGLKRLLDKYQCDRATDCFNLKTSGGHLCVDGGKKHLSDTLGLCGQISLWADAQNSAQKVLQHLKLAQTTHEFLLSDTVNKKFLEFQQDFIDECGSEDKQHSWAVIEKQEEIVMYGPYYPNYNNGLHSEDVIIKQTEELLKSEDVSVHWRLYIFTMNSPCLARNTDPCMLKLVQKAQKWWSIYGVKTHIGYVKCWGFKGTKENLFRDINCSHMEFINQSGDYEKYVKEKQTELNPVCEDLFSAVKHLLKSTSFPLIDMVQEQDWRSYFKSLHALHGSKPEDTRIITQEIDSVIEAAQTLLSGESGPFEDYLDKGRAFVSEFTFSSQMSDQIQEQIKLTFQECWREMVQDKFAESIKERLTEDFNYCTVQLFIKDVVKFAKEYLQIGRIQFSEEAQHYI